MELETLYWAFSLHLRDEGLIYMKKLQNECMDASKMQHASETNGSTLLAAKT